MLNYPNNEANFLVPLQQNLKEKNYRIYFKIESENFYKVYFIMHLEV